MRRSRIWIVFSMLCGLEGVLAEQIILERGLGTAGAATSTAPSRGLRKSVSGVMDSLNKAVKTGLENSGSRSTPAPRMVYARPVEADESPAAPPRIPLPARIYEDPGNIREGMANEELIRRFGPPALEVTGSSTGRLLTYYGKTDVVQLEVRDEKVTLIAARNSQQAAIILPAEQGFRQIP